MSMAEEYAVGGAEWLKDQQDQDREMKVWTNGVRDYDFCHQCDGIRESWIDCSSCGSNKLSSTLNEYSFD